MATPYLVLICQTKTRIVIINLKEEADEIKDSLLLKKRYWMKGRISKGEQKRDVVEYKRFSGKVKSSEEGYKKKG